MPTQIPEVQRCRWAVSDLMIQYHDTEWGVPLHDDRGLFEFLILEGAQAGLSWETILKKRDAYRKAFANFDAKKVAKFDKSKIESLMQNAGIVRNRLKIEGSVKNAKAFLEVQREFGTFDAYIWRFVDNKPIRNARSGSVPAKTPISDAMSKDLKKRGFTFVGSTICYAFMQATGMVDDHLAGCFRRAPNSGPPEARPMTDEELIQSFEALAFPFDQWTHRTHVKIAYCYLGRYSFEEALAKMRAGIKAFNAQHAIPETATTGYNETTTHAFLHLIAATMQAYDEVFSTDNADSFCDVHAQLMTKHALRLFYSPHRRMHPRAKTQFVEPDLAPLPHFNDKRTEGN